MHLGVQETNDAIALRFQPGRPRGVILRLIRRGMRVTVYFDDEFGLGAVKVNDETTDRMLFAKVQTI